MPPRSTPRLCAHCGNELGTDDERVVLEDARTGERLLVHRSCLVEHFERVMTGFLEWREAYDAAVRAGRIRPEVDDEAGQEAA